MGLDVVYASYVVDVVVGDKDALQAFGCLEKRWQVGFDPLSCVN